MLIDRKTGFVRITWEKQYCIDTTHPLLTVQCSDWLTLSGLGLDRETEGLLDPRQNFFPYVTHAYPTELQDELPSIGLTDFTELVVESYTPEPKAYKWVRWVRSEDKTGEEFVGYVVGYCLPHEINMTRTIYCLSADVFQVFPLQALPEDFEVIEVFGDIPSNVLGLDEDSDSGV